VDPAVEKPVIAFVEAVVGALERVPAPGGHEARLRAVARGCDDEPGRRLRPVSVHVVYDRFPGEVSPVEPERGRDAGVVVSRHPYGIPRRVLRHVAKRFQVVPATDGAEPRDPPTIANEEYEEDSDVDEFSPKVPS